MVLRVVWTENWANGDKVGLQTWKIDTPPKDLCCPATSARAVSRVWLAFAPTEDAPPELGPLDRALHTRYHPF